ncbi:unnamed protein product [Adineta ricciae]|uniref:Uncharacterized protein n=1 Tax=Adineta ricciae TaxID=249248 RepID=A0A815NHG9_ADIRI|nr:unnamed protein product [Adineta ricciae]
MESKGEFIIRAINTFPVNPKIEQKKKLARRRSIIREFSLNTSMHGVPGIARSESVQNRIFWTVAFLIFAGIMFFFVIQAILAYFQYPTQTSVSIVSDRQQYFPALTFCNAGALRYDTFQQLLLNYTNSINLTSPTSTSAFSSNQANIIKIYLPILLNQGVSLDPYMFSLDALMMDCQFGQARCSAEDFISFYSSAYGRCYTFNAKTKNNSLYYNYMSSDVTTLTLRLYLYDHLYVSYLTEGVGMTAMVHDNKQLPLIERAGMTLAPGFKHQMTFTKKTVYSLPSPYSSCTNEIPLAMKIMFDQYEGADYSYSEDICYILCAQAYIYEQCGCVFPGQWNARSIVLPGSNQIIVAPLCNSTDSCFAIAMNNFDATPSIQEKYCSGCSQQCSITNFIVKSSIMTTPPEWIIGDIKAFVENSSLPLASDWSTNWREHIHASYVSLAVSGESTLVENYTEVATLGFVDVISNVGGQTGLWIGISFLSLVEVLEMLYRLVRYHVYLVRRGLKTNQPNTPKPDYDIESVQVKS